MNELTSKPLGARVEGADSFAGEAVIDCAEDAFAGPTLAGTTETTLPACGEATVGFAPVNLTPLALETCLKGAADETRQIKARKACQSYGHTIG